MSKKVEQYFKDFSESPKVFETTDGTLFHQGGDANLFQGSIDKTGKVKVYHKSDFTTKTKDAGTGAEFMDVVVTQEVLDLNPEMVEQGVTVGETIQVPVKEDEKPVKKTKGAGAKGGNK